MATSTSDDLVLGTLPDSRLLPRVYSLWPPRIESDEALDLATTEVACIDAHADRVKADTKDAIARVQRHSLERLEVTVGTGDQGKTLTAAEWRAALLEAIEKYCNRHRDELLEDGRKSFDKNMARCGWRDDPPGLDPLPDFDDAGNEKLLADVTVELRKKLSSISKFGPYLEVEVSWRKKELLRAHLERELTLTLLKKAGFTVREAHETFYVTPRTNDVASQSAGKRK